MTRELSELFERASKLAEQGEHVRSAAEYETFLRGVAASSGGWEPKDRDFAVRSASFNLAQVYNHLRLFAKALDRIADGLSCSPSQVGRAIAFAAQGEAQCGLGEIEKGKAAFDQAVAAHRIIGRLNVADSITRVASADMLSAAEQLLSEVENPLLQEQSKGTSGAQARIAELYTIRGKISSRRGQRGEAKKWFEKALQVEPSYEDAKLQIRKLPTGGFFSRMFGGGERH